MWEKIKKILQQERGKCIIMKEGEPTYIVSLLDDCEESDLAETKEVNQPIAQSDDSYLTGIAEQESKKTPIQEEAILEAEEFKNNNAEKESNQEVKIEDLPF